MSQRSGKKQPVEWVNTVATIDGCNRTLWMSLTGGIDAYGELAMDTFVITYVYFVGNRTFRGKYRANSPQEVGQALEISYDPSHPERNTGTGTYQNGWARVAIWICVVAFTLFAAYLEKHLELPSFWPR